MAARDEQHRCYNGGRLVPAAEPIPDAAADHIWAPTVPGGCNSLSCRGCGQSVRWHVADDGAGRVYSCGCSEKVVHTRRWIENWPADEFTDSVPPWGCAGHPVRVPPFELDGVRVDPAQGWVDLIERAATAAVQPAERPAFLPPYELGWLERIAATVPAAERRRFDAAAAQLVATLSGGPLKALLELVRLAQLPEAARRVVAGAVGGTSGLADPGLQPLVIAIVEQAPAGATRTDALRQLVQSPHSSAGGLVWQLAERDADWLATNAANILRQYPERGSHLFAALAAQAKPLLPRAIEGALDGGVGSRGDLERAIWDAFDEPERSAWLARLDSHPG